MLTGVISGRGDFRGCLFACFLHSCNVKIFWSCWLQNGGKLGSIASAVEPGFEFILCLLEAPWLWEDT